ncbi:MAG: DUF6051 family protein [Bacteroidota bacterium]
MDYSDNQLLLKKTFNLSDEQIRIPESDTRIINCRFRSVVQPEAGETSHIAVQDGPLSGLMLQYFEGNSDFTYPVFMPGNKDQSDGAIILLHGLNERSWSKYLYWAQYLSENTGKAVILFPIAYHINRSPGFWADPRSMVDVATERANSDSENSSVTPFNAALSSRLDMHPEWFCTSGLQSCYDIISLTEMIRSGKHRLFKTNASVDFFAYSVGAFLLEVMLIANPDNLFGWSKSFLFLGGSSFEQMKGISKYIMDSKAFDKLEKVFLMEDPKAVRQKIHIPRLNSFNSLWNSFMSMLRMDRLQTVRDRSFKRLCNQISAVGLARDQVIPGSSIFRTLMGAGNRNRIPVAILDFPYPYTHENPFPINQQDIRQEVNRAFGQVFNQAASFLS